MAATSDAREAVRRPRLAEIEAINKRNTRPSAGSVAVDTFSDHVKLSKSLAQSVCGCPTRVYTQTKAVLAVAIEAPG